MPTVPQSVRARELPLVVDLDGTLINTDILHEGFLLLLRKNPFYLFTCIIWLLKGRAHLKCKILKLVQVPIQLLPVNKDVVEFIQFRFKQGTPLILATASPLSIAREIAKVYPIFDEVYGTTENNNLKGRRKLKLLVDKYGALNFDYIGNSHSDIIIFGSARKSYLVQNGVLFKRKLKSLSNITCIPSSNKPSLKVYLKAIRVHQWVKNLLVFIPLITSHSFFSLERALQTFGAFIAFSLMASSGYLLNDLLDLKSDRLHPKKQFRPLASGRISILSGLILTGILFTSAISLALLLNTMFLIILVIYFLTSLSYSLFFKKKVLYDVFILALLYSVRIVAGGVVTNISLSFWLILFSTFIFLSLAFVKRYSELIQTTSNRGLTERGRDYFVKDISLLQTMGIASGFLSIVVFSLYIDSIEISKLYTYPKMLWVISFLLMFWISRVWLITNRGKMDDDPIIFAIKDATSYFISFIIGLVIFFAI